MAFKITHIVVGKVQNYWVPAHFITQKSEDQNFYFYEFERIHLEKEMIEARVENGTYAKVAMPIEVVNQRKLWLAPDGNYYLSIWTESPDKDPNKIRLSLVDKVAKS